MVLSIAADVEVPGTVSTDIEDTGPLAPEARSAELANALLNRELGRDTAVIAPAGIVVPECYTRVVVEPDEPQQALIDRWTRATRRARLAIDVGLTPEQSELVNRLTLRTGVNGENARTKGRDQVLNLLSNLPSLAETCSMASRPTSSEPVRAWTTSRPSSGSGCWRRGWCSR
jgi:hypothetical protein